MDDLISRSNLMTVLNIKEDCHDCVYEASGFCTRVSEFVNACEAITYAPSIDAVEVVRCKDCKHYAGEGMYCAQDICVQFDHFFCYYGERKEE